MGSMLLWFLPLKCIAGETKEKMNKKPEVTTSGNARIQIYGVWLTKPSKAMWF